MPRIPLVSAKSAGWLTRLIYRFVRRQYGAVPEPAAVVAHHTSLLLAAGAGDMMAERAVRSLPANLRSLATYRVATKIGCSWCVDFGTMLQRDEGLDIDRLREIDDYATSARFTEQERRVLSYADAMTDEPMTVTDEQVAVLDQELGHRHMVALTYVIALENLRTRFNHALGLTAQGFTSGEACRLPVP